MALLILLLSLIALIWASHQLINGAAGIANYYNLSPMLTGFTLVALGTSTPEIMIAINAAMDGVNDIALGNAIGTNIANIGLILGIIALLRPLNMQSSFLRREFPLLFIAMLFTYSLMLDGYLGVVDSCLSLAACVVFIGYILYISAPNQLQKKVTESIRQAVMSRHSLKSYVLSFVTGIIVLSLSADLLIKKTMLIAHTLGLDELFVSLTVIALGSSLPELATALIAARKGADDIAIGTILGANLFNLIAVMAFPGIIHPSAISHAILWRDMPVMFITTFILFWINARRARKITRWHGGLLILVYICYMISLVVCAIH
ncbi:calcium/sodium antiporter [Legionella dresdenensis]|uniref:Calcium/sodium antiporter n=1 Tax=Legionella dresdenensis TaxID=450200 RepID=A0ABV8CBX0_9GAMM